MTRSDMHIAICLTALVVMSLGIGPALVLAGSAPAGADIVLIVAPDAADVVARAGGHLVGPAQAPFSALAQVDPAVVAELTDYGAWWVLDAARIAALCGVSVETKGGDAT